MDARRWIDDLDPQLGVQARLLHALLDAVEAEPRWDALELSCSLAAGRADALSDLDLGLWPAGPDRPPDQDVMAMLRAPGPVVEVSMHPWDGVPRWWVQYADGGQVDLVVLPADGRRWRAPGGVALLDRSGRLDRVGRPGVLHAEPEDLRHWLLDGWEALGNVAKHLQRGSLLEAVEQLQRTRTCVYQLWAAGEDVDYPAFGLTSLLDDPRSTLPDDIGATYPPPEHAAVRAAALTAAHSLTGAAHHADPSLDTPLVVYVTRRLTAL